MGISNFMRGRLEGGFTSSLLYWKLIKVILKRERKLKCLALCGRVTLRSSTFMFPSLCCWAPAMAAPARSSKVPAVTGHVTIVTRVVTSSTVALGQSWHWLPCAQAGQGRSLFWIHGQALWLWVFLGQVISPPNPLVVSIALSTWTVLPAWLQKENKHVNSCALVYAKYLISKCLSNFLVFFEINCLRTVSLPVMATGRAMG